MCVCVCVCVYAQVNSKELTKQLGQKDAELKAKMDDFALKEKDLMRQLKALEEEKNALEKSGAAKLQDTQVFVLHIFIPTHVHTHIRTYTFVCVHFFCFFLCSF